MSGIDYESVRDSVHGKVGAELVSFLKANGVEDPAEFIIGAIYAKAKDAVYRKNRNQSLSSLNAEIASLKEQLSK